jgi:hypothetical protein
MKQLRFSTTIPMGMLGIMNPKEDHIPLQIPTDIGKLIRDPLKGNSVYIHGGAETLAGYDIPTFFDGNIGQLDLPIEEQDILMLLPSGEYKCKAELSKCCYLITLVTEPSALK